MFNRKFRDGIFSNPMIVKSRLGVVQGHWKWRRSIRLTSLCNYSLTLYCFRVIPRWIMSIVTLKSRLKVTRGHWKLHHSINRIRIPISVNSNNGAILYRLRDIGRKSLNFYTPLVLAPADVNCFSPCRNFTKMFDTHKTRMIGLPCSSLKKLRRVKPIGLPREQIKHQYRLHVLT